jgi:hypothetical protein
MATGSKHVRWQRIEPDIFLSGDWAIERHDGGGYTYYVLHHWTPKGFTEVHRSPLLRLVKAKAKSLQR